jgi:hypothetical protein
MGLGALRSLTIPLAIWVLFRMLVSRASPVFIRIKVCRRGSLDNTAIMILKWEANLAKDMASGDSVSNGACSSGRVIVPPSQPCCLFLFSSIPLCAFLIFFVAVDFDGNLSFGGGNGIWLGRLRFFGGSRPGLPEISVPDPYSLACSGTQSDNLPQQSGAVVFLNDDPIDSQTRVPRSAGNVPSCVQYHNGFSGARRAVPGDFHHLLRSVDQPGL